MSDATDAAVHLDIPTWTPPWPASTPTYVRLTPTHLRANACAEQVARKARPDVFADDRAPWEPAGEGSFPLGLARDALLDHLRAPQGEQQADADGTDVDPVTAAIDRAIAASYQDWPDEVRPAVMACVIGYLQVLESLRADGRLGDAIVVPDLVALQDPDGDRVELWAWVIHHISVDGSVREAHVLRVQRADHVALPTAEAALVAHVAGSGVIVEHDKWWKRFEPARGMTQPPPAKRVVVRVIGLLDATSDVRFDGTPAEAAELVAELVPPALGMLAGGSYRPGSGCAGCNIRHVCTGVSRMPGLLGVTGYSPHVRALSPSDLWTHRACPRQLRLKRDLGLPRTPMGDSPALLRGTQVHAWLAAAHARGRACAIDDLPESVVDDGPHVGLDWTADDYDTNRPYLLHHLGQCPFDGQVSDLTTELSITAWDTDANVVFSTRPDTAWLNADRRWVLRETKTLSPRGLPEDRTELLERYPQVAAAVCLLADGYTPDGMLTEGPGIVELELLGPDAGAVLGYDAADPIVVLVARTALADRVDAWLFDTEHPIGANPPCRSCEVFRWCEISPVSAVEDITADLIPVIPVNGHDWAAPDAVLGALAAAIEEEDFPF